VDEATIYARRWWTLAVLGVIEAPSKSWGNTWVLAGFIGGLAILAAFVLWERAIDHPCWTCASSRTRGSREPASP
jgi:hypothetical protein